MSKPRKKGIMLSQIDLRMAIAYEYLDTFGFEKALEIVEYLTSKSCLVTQYLEEVPLAKDIIVEVEEDIKSVFGVSDDCLCFLCGEEFEDIEKALEHVELLHDDFLEEAILYKPIEIITPIFYYSELKTKEEIFPPICPETRPKNYKPRPNSLEELYFEPI